MSKEELIDKMVAEVMEEFDFDRVRRIMVNLGWKWDIGDGEMAIPSTYRIMKKAEGLLVSAANHYGEDNYSCGSGGFMAHLDGTTLTLQFVLAEMTSYADDFINTEEPKVVDADFEETDDVLHKPLKEFYEEGKISCRTFNVLKAAGAQTFGDVTKLTLLHLLKVRSCGKKTIADAENLLHEYGYDWAVD